ncbi:MAG: Uncharacterized protein XD76_0002 [candidate division TA06 bacterium 32_111]|uniref:Uncharacterized protein n=1 Tax=candidate division TA06 bacterium 34_109 TaxID=1635277 RepID=A0A117M779_UNCT6|nr:MAG: Uncharacterized protein XD76_0002 [candidate division TA06 bacterium 32_111]KUK88182.1 MAG: Uncharacterized protein XE03_0188 [candidate division TA06 bacterium 34_109]
MRIKTQNNGHLKGHICEQFAYTPYLVGYPKCSDMNELYDMAAQMLTIKNGGK